MIRELRWLLGIGAVLVMAMATLVVMKRPAPPKAPPLPMIRELGTFSVTNQAGVVVDRTALLGRPWAIDLIFTRCPGPCARLSGVMRSIQEGLPARARAGLLSVTSDPEYDTPAVLREYAEKFEADPNRWQFVTGATAAIRKLAIEELLLVLQDKPAADRESEEDLFLHSTRIVLVDSRGRIRDFVDGLEPGADHRVLERLRSLEAEE